MDDTKIELHSNLSIESLPHLTHTVDSRSLELLDKIEENFSLIRIGLTAILGFYSFKYLTKSLYRLYTIIKKQ